MWPNGKVSSSGRKLPGTETLNRNSSVRGMGMSASGGGGEIKVTFGSSRMFWNSLRL